MLTDYFEPFTLLKSASCPDPYGGQLQQDVGHAAVHVGQDGPPHGLLGHKGQRLAGQKVQPVHIGRVIGADKLPRSSA